MKGTIKVYFEDKQFGFIVDDKEVEYFFHKSKVQENHSSVIQKGMQVIFDVKETKKGLTAEKIIVSKKKKYTTNKYVLPNTIYTSRHEHIEKWETIFKSDYVIHMTDKGNPHDLKQNLIDIASDIGANCILELTYNTEKGSEPGKGSGTHYFTVHHYSARLAFIARKSTKGILIDKNKIDKIDSRLLENSDDIIKRYSASSMYGLILFIGLIGLLVYLNIDVISGEKEFEWIGLIIPFVVFGTLAGYINNHTRCWIEDL